MDARCESATRNNGLAVDFIFDLRGVDTYYTRPMPEAWSQLSDIDRLAEGHADLEFEFSLDQLSRLRAKFGAVGGLVRGTAHFERQAGLPVAELKISGAAELVCQRCLTPMRSTIEGVTRVALIASEAEADRVPEDLEPVLAPDDRVRLCDLVEEELLLSLPIVPLHANPRDCGAGYREAETEGTAGAQVTQRPFERLGELLKRDS